MTPEPEDAAPLTVSVVLERRLVARGSLSVPSWRLVGLFPGAEGAPAAGRRIHAAEDAEQFLWSGLEVRLEPGAAESYWFNLVGRRPALLVVCRADAETGLAPVTVTPDHDLGGAHMEADDTVLSAPLPAALVPRLERFVMAHYRPQERKRRKRKNWKDEQAHG